MRNSRWSMTLLILIWCLNPDIVMASSACRPDTGSDPMKVAVTVLQFPLGPVDGNNMSFSLREPQVGSNIQVFEDGEELERDSAFHVDNPNVVTFAKPPRPGQVLQVVYCTQEVGLAPRESLSSDDTRALIRTALVESIKRDDISASQDLRPQQDDSPTSPKPTPRAMGPRSTFIRTLSTRIQDGGGRINEQRISHEVDGLEGTGDVPLIAPLEALLKQSTPRDGHPTREVGVGESLRSLRLLQERLADATSSYDHTNQGRRP